MLLGAIESSRNGRRALAWSVQKTISLRDVRIPRRKQLQVVYCRSITDLVYFQELIGDRDKSVISWDYSTNFDEDLVKL